MARARIGEGDRLFLLTVAATQGSAPREPGAKLLVGRDRQWGTIGGGQLEYLAVGEARELLGREGPQVALIDFALGPDLGQCCGGRVFLVLERLERHSLDWLAAWEDLLKSEAGGVALTPLEGGGGKRLLAAGTAGRTALPAALRRRIRDFEAGSGADAEIASLPSGESFLLERVGRKGAPLYLFGAGHVGQALVRALAGLPFRVVWIDERSALFPDLLPENVEPRPSRLPASEVGEAPPGSFFLVMTHSHNLDLEVCDAVLRRGDFAFLGLIGSASKRARFLQRLKARGHEAALLSRLTTPIGLSGITGKSPAEIAAATVAQLLLLRVAGEGGAAVRRRDSDGRGVT